MVSTIPRTNNSPRATLDHPYIDIILKEVK